MSKSASYLIAEEIESMLELRAAGQLKKRGSDDFISGLIKAYALIVGESDVVTAMHLAHDEVNGTLMPKL